MLPGVFLIAAACVLRSPDGDTAGSAGTDGSTTGSTTGATGEGEPTSGSMESSGMPTTSAEPTTGGEPPCPLGPDYAPGWSSELSLPVPAHSSRTAPSLVTLSDGRLAFSAITWPDDGTFVPGVFWVAPEGQPIAWVAGSAIPVFNAHLLGLRVAEDDTVVLAGTKLAETSRGPYFVRFAPGGSELAQVDAQTQKLVQVVDFELLGDAVVLVGRDPPDNNMWLARVDATSGAIDWEVQLPSSGTPIARAAAVGLGGEIVAAANVEQDADAFRLWRVDDAGAVLWQADVHSEAPSSGWVRDLVVTPAGHVVAATTRDTPVPRLALVAFALADGAPAWELEVAVETDAGTPVLQQLLVVGDELVVPVVHGQDPWDFGVDGPMTAALHRVSSAGAPLSTRPLTPGQLEGSPWLALTRGICGDVVVLQNNTGSPWLGSSTP